MAYGGLVSVLVDSSDDPSVINALTMQIFGLTSEIARRPDHPCEPFE